MVYSGQPTSSIPISEPTERALFIRRVYGHLAGAILLFMLLECILLPTAITRALLSAIINGGRIGWLAVIGGFSLVTWMARGMAANTSRPVQYAGLGLYTLAEALIFLPLIAIAVVTAPSALPSAAILTLALFVGLTVVAATSRYDFSFLGGILAVGGCVALGLIVCAALFGFQLGLLFSGGMVLLASGAILYDTSKIFRQYSREDYVAASVQLFASVMLLFWYILRLFISRRR